MTSTALERLGEGLEVSPTSLSVTDPNLTYERFEAALAGCAVIGDSARWWLGDLLLFGEARYGEEYAQALQAARLSERQLNEYRYVCQQVARSRRRENLPFSYHRAVAALEPADQDALLARAERDGWSRERLREAITDLRSVDPPPAHRRSIISASVSTVAAAGGLVDVRRTLHTVRDTITTEEGREAVGIPAALRGIEEASKAVQQLGRVLSLRDASVKLRDVAVRQSGLADPAYFVPAGPFEEFLAALEEAE